MNIALMAFPFRGGGRRPCCSLLINVFDEIFDFFGNGIRPDFIDDEKDLLDLLAKVPRNLVPGFTIHLLEKPAGENQLVGEAIVQDLQQLLARNHLIVVTDNHGGNNACDDGFDDERSLVVVHGNSFVNFLIMVVVEIVNGDILLSHADRILFHVESFPGFCPLFSELSGVAPYPALTVL